jgi:oligopeptide transport system substrate-binding protein
MINLYNTPKSITPSFGSKKISYEKETPEPVNFVHHHTFNQVHQKLAAFRNRFPHLVDQSIFNDMLLFYLPAAKEFLDHRKPAHLFRLILSTYFFQRKILKECTLYPHLRHLEVRWLPTTLLFPFSSKSALGCLVGFNEMNRYEIFDEENIVLALQKYLPEAKLVSESFYAFTSQHRNIKIFYLEIEKKDRTPFSLTERDLLKCNLKKKIEKSIQTLSPSIFMGNNDEEAYKTILTLSQEIQTFMDLPQVNIQLEQQTTKEIVFRIALVQISPFHRFSLKERFVNSMFVPQRSMIVRHLEEHPIEAHLFHLRLPRHASLLRSDGSLDFYSARREIVSLLTSAIGTFRDYNGGIIEKQQELLIEFKEKCAELCNDPEYLETFFYSIIPLEKQIILDIEILSMLFSLYMKNREVKHLDKDFFFKTFSTERRIYLCIYGGHRSLSEAITTAFQEHPLKTREFAYNILENEAGVFLNGVFLDKDSEETPTFIEDLKFLLNEWHKKIKNQQVLRIGLEYSVVSLDPRIGGETISGNILRLLFEGLTRLDQKGNIENGIAQSIEISPNKTRYIFKLRPSLWNDGSPVTAYDFEYAWKKILSPSFTTSFAHLFHPIKNAKQAKEGQISIDQIGVQALDSQTLKVDLERPTSYFLQLTALPLYSPVHHIVDQQHPEWPYQNGEKYPCNGPFQIKINQPNQGYQLTKNPYYWDKDGVVLDQVSFTRIDPASAMQAFQKREIDWIGNPFGNSNPAFIHEKKGQKISVPNVWAYWLVFNTSCFPFNNSKLRQAFAYMIQREQLIANSSLPLDAAYSVSPPDYNTRLSTQFPKINLEEARRLFAEALEELGIKKEEFPLLNLTFVEKGVREGMAVSLQEQAKESLGIKFVSNPLPWTSMFNSLVKGNFQIAIAQWASMVSDPAYTLSTFRSASIELNFPQWENEEFQKWLELAERECNPFQNSIYMRKAEDVLRREAPVIPLVYAPSQTIVEANLQMPNPSLGLFYHISKSKWRLT